MYSYHWMRYIKAAHKKENVLFSLKLETQNDSGSFFSRQCVIFQNLLKLITS